MGYIVSAPAPKLNIDKYGNPKDYATYVWLLYKRHVVDDSPTRRAFLYGPENNKFFSFSLQYDYK